MSQVPYLIDLRANRQEVTRKVPFAKLFSLLLVCGLISGLFLGGQQVSAEQVMLVANDTLAGRETKVNAMGVPAGQKVVFDLQRPDGSQMQLEVLADQQGEADLEIYGKNTLKAGSYQIRVGEDITEFTVYPADLSIANCKVGSDKTRVEVGGDRAVLQATIKDAYGNPITKETLQVVGSRGTDAISYPYGQETDANGQIVAYLSSAEAGQSTFAVVDLIKGITLPDRIKINFYQSQPKASGGSFYASIMGLLAATESSSADHLAFLEPPAQVNAGQAFTLRIAAKKASDEVAQDYTGTIRFSSSDTNAVLPRDYTFNLNNSGEKSFDLAFTLNTPGSQSITVTDTGNEEIQGMINNITVKGQGVAEDALTPTIESPATDTKTNNHVLTITGKAAPLTYVYLYDHGTDEIIKGEVGEDGSYQLETPALSDGVHGLTVYTVDGKDNTSPISNEVVVTVDTTPAAINDLQVNPSEVAAGSDINVELTSEEGLSVAEVILDNKNTALVADSDHPEIYKAVVKAPSQAGTYDVSIKLVDDMQNEQTYENQLQITVTQSDTTPPSDVTSLSAQRAADRITLSWGASSDDVGIAKYRVYYGPNQSWLDFKVDLPDARTTWFIDNLQQGVDYYFAVTAIDAAGNESAVKNEYKIKSSLLPPLPNGTSQSGPAEMLVLVSLLALAGAGVWQLRLSRIADRKRA